MDTRNPEPENDEPGEPLPFCAWQMMHEDRIRRHPLAVPRSLEVVRQGAE